MKRRRANVQEDHTGMAFMIAAFAAVAALYATEWVYYNATDLAFWGTGHLHSLSLFIGTLSFVCCLYGLQVLNNRKSPTRYLHPYIPLLGVSGLNLALKRNNSWLIPFAVVSVLWSVFQVRTSRR